MLHLLVPSSGHLVSPTAAPHSPNLNDDIGDSRLSGRRLMRLLVRWSHAPSSSLMNLPAAYCVVCPDRPDAVRVPSRASLQRRVYRSWLCSTFFGCYMAMPSRRRPVDLNVHGSCPAHRHVNLSASTLLTPSSPRPPHPSCSSSPTWPSPDPEIQDSSSSPAPSDSAPSCTADTLDSTSYTRRH